MGRLVSVLVLGSAFLMAMPASPARAHGDAEIADEVVILAPGGAARFDAEVHYHRLVGRITADGPVLVRFIGEDGDAFTAGPATTLELNELIPCCEGGPWVPHALVVENASDSTPVTARVDAGLIHDDLAVTVYRAESGIVPSIALFGGIWAFALWRICLLYTSPSPRD